MARLMADCPHIESVQLACKLGRPAAYKGMAGSPLRKKKISCTCRPVGTAGGLAAYRLAARQSTAAIAHPGGRVARRASQRPAGRPPIAIGRLADEWASGRNKSQHMHHLYERPSVGEQVRVGASISYLLSSAYICMQLHCFNLLEAIR